MLFKFFVLDDKRRYLFNSDYNDDDQKKLYVIK